jgi:general secretion pathway protein A
MKYEAYWGLRESPFREARNPAGLVASPTHDEAVARLHFLAENHRPVGILSGCQGGGKSLVLATFARHLRDLGRTACLLRPLGQDAWDFLWSAASALGVNPRNGDDAFRLWRQIGDRLRAAQYVGEMPILLVDDADSTSAEVRVLILRWLKSEIGKGLTVILASQPSRVHQLGTDLLQLCVLHIRLEKWQPADIRDYLHTNLSRAGRTGSSELFQESAVNRLHELTEGVPRYVSQLAELALVAGAAQRLDVIDAEAINAVFQELNLGTAVEADHLLGV